MSTHSYTVEDFLKAHPSAHEYQGGSGSWYIAERYGVERLSLMTKPCDTPEQAWLEVMGNRHAATQCRQETKEGA